MNEFFKTKPFNRWAEKENLTDQELYLAMKEVESGLVEASLGSYLFKKRVAKFGQGKRGSYRSILAFKRDQRFFFIFGFDKGTRDNISDKEKEALKKLSKELMGYSEIELEQAVVRSSLIKVECGNE
mgnify:CR=1 FL=1